MHGTKGRRSNARARRCRSIGIDSPRWELVEPFSSQDEIQLAVDRTLGRWGGIAKSVAALGDGVTPFALDIKLDIRESVSEPYRVSIAADQLRSLADTQGAGLGVSVYDTREHPEVVASETKLGMKRAGLVDEQGDWVLQHCALPEADTWILVNSALRGMVGWFTWDAERLRKQRAATFLVLLPLHHAAHFDTGFSFEEDELRVMTELGVSIHFEVCTLP